MKYDHIAKHVEARFHTSDYELDRSLPRGKNKKVIELIKYELGRKIVTKFAGLRTKNYSYLIHDSSEDKKAKGTKKCVIKIWRLWKLYNKISSLQKNKINIYCVKNHKKFIRNNKSMLEIQ